MTMSKFLRIASTIVRKFSLPTNSAAFGGIRPEVRTQRCGLILCIKSFGLATKAAIFFSLVRISEMPMISSGT